MRILMMGTGPFAVPTFSGLLNSPHEVPALITRPLPTSKGRPRDVTATHPMIAYAQEHAIPIEAPDRIGTPEALAMLGAFDADLLVVCDYGQILPAAALATARLGGINLHGSLLPKYRGAAPINWALYRGEVETGVSVIRMTPRLDAGPCLEQKVLEIGPAEDAVQLESRLAESGWHAVRDAITKLEQWDGVSPLGSVQEKDSVTQAPRLRKADGEIDWRRSAVDIFNQVRAFKPWPGTFTVWSRPKGPLRLLLTQVAVAEDTSSLGPAGTVIRADDDQLLVACGQGSLRLRQIQPAGKNPLTAQQFLRGYPLRPGDRLGAPAK